MLNGSGVAPIPMGILALPVNPANTYAYSARSPNVTFGQPATWASVVQFEATLDGGAQVHNDGTYGWAAAPDVRTKWMQVPKVATYPEFLWQQPDTGIDGRVAGRKAVNSSQLPPGTVIFGRWSDAMIASWAGAEILVNPFVKAVTAEHLITLNLFGLRSVLNTVARLLVAAIQLRNRPRKDNAAPRVAAAATVTWKRRAYITRTAGRACIGITYEPGLTVIAPTL